MPVESTEPLAEPIEVPCPDCDYNLHGVEGDRCPSCGWAIDFQVLISQARTNHAARRLAVGGTALVVGLAALLALVSLANRGRRLSLADGFIVLSVALASAGHIGLAVVAAMRQRRWPMRSGVAAELILFAALASILLGVAGATQFYDGLPAQRVVRGVEVSGVLEFLVAAMLLVMPGAMLLTLRLVSFGARIEPVRPAKQHAGSSLPVRAAFTIDFLQRLGPGQVSTTWSPILRSAKPETEARITEAWTAQSRIAAESNRRFFDGRLIGLIGARLGRDRLHLELGPTTFREFLGTHLHHAAATALDDPDALANAIGVSAVVVCSDHILAFGRRGRSVAFHADHLHTFGGMLEQADLSANGTCNVFAAIRREIREEAGVVEAETRGVTLLGLVRDRDILQPELIFEVNLGLTSKALLARFDRDAPGQEHSGLEFVSEDPDAVLPFLRRASPVAPIAEAALLLHGRHIFGTDWYEQTCYVLYGELPPATERLGVLSPRRAQT